MKIKLFSKKTYEDDGSVQNNHSRNYEHLDTVFSREKRQKDSGKQELDGQGRVCFSAVQRKASQNDQNGFSKNGNKIPWKKIFIIIGIITLMMSIMAVVLHACSGTNISTNEENEIPSYVEVKSGDKTLSVNIPQRNNIETDEDTGVQFVNNELIITGEKGINQNDIISMITPYGGKIVGNNDFLNTFQIQFDRIYDFKQLEELKKNIEGNKGVRFVNINYYFSAEEEGYPNDNEWANNWKDNSKYTWGVRAINAPKMWDEFTDKMISPTNVGVLDNQFYEEHEDLSYSETFCNNFDAKESPHGTHVSGTIAAKYNNGKGIAGIASSVNLYGASILGMENREVKTDNMGITVSSIEAGFTYLICIKECKVINISYKWFLSSGSTIFFENIDASYHVVAALLDFISEGYDFILIKASGNSCEDANTDAVFSRLTSEELRNRLITVGACGEYEDGNINVCEFSNYGDTVDLVAPGKDIYSTIFNRTLFGVRSTYKYYNGTSMAAPHVTGVVAAMWSVNPSLTGPQVKSIICSTAAGNYSYLDTDENNNQYSNFTTALQYSYPMLDAYAAVSSAYQYKQQKKSNNNNSLSNQPGNHSSLLGTYYSVDGLQKFTFKENNGITMNAFGINGEGTYEIKDGYLIVNYVIPLFGDKQYTWKVDFKYANEDSIYIASTEFVKADH